LGQRFAYEGGKPPILEAANVKLYPNPASNDISVSVNIPDMNEGSLTLIDMSGRLVKHVKLAVGQNMVSLDGIPNGIYLAEVMSNQAIVYRTKLVVAR
jgi:Secretion system C-terminal sorting domain